LQIIHNRVPKHDVIIILDDINAKIGYEKTFNQVLGRYSFHDISNENGELAANYDISNDMFLISNNFQRKKILIGTWMSPDHHTVNQSTTSWSAKDRLG
jgi:hypothetical protein